VQRYCKCCRRSRGVSHFAERRPAQLWNPACLEKLQAWEFCNYARFRCLLAQATFVPFAASNGLFIGDLLIFAYAACTLDGGNEICKLRFSPMATQPNPLDDPLQDFQFPQREAAFFYGLFLRGHTADELRRDIAVPAAVLAKWDRETVREPTLRPLLERIVRYRRHVLAIFENLICHDSEKQRLQ